MLTGFFIAIGANITLAWLAWFSAQKEHKLGAYLKIYGGRVGKGLIVDIFALALWKLGLLGYVAEQLGVRVVPEGYVLPGGADFWLGFALGFIVDTVGKRFMPAIDRAASKTAEGLTTLSGKLPKKGD